MPSRSSSQPEQVTDLGPRVVLVASVSHCVRQPNLDLALQAGEQVHRDRGVAQPVQSAKRTQGGHGLVEDRFADLVGVRADVVSTVCRCHSRIMPDTTVFVIQAGREHPEMSTPTPMPYRQVSNSLSPGLAIHASRAATHPIDEPNPGTDAINPPLLRGQNS